MTDVAELRRLLEKAGLPWVTRERGLADWPNSPFIVAAVNALPELLSRLEVAESKAREAKVQGMREAETLCREMSEEEAIVGSRLRPGSSKDERTGGTKAAFQLAKRIRALIAETERTGT